MNIKFGAILKYVGGALMAIGIINPILNQYGYTIKNIPVIGWPLGIGMAVVGGACFYFGWKMEKEGK